MNITDAKEFGNAIKNRRKELGYTQAFLSDFTGMSISFISDVEHGKETVELGKVIRLANVLGMNLDVVNRQPIQ